MDPQCPLGATGRRCTLQLPHPGQGPPERLRGLYLPSLCHLQGQPFRGLCPPSPQVPPALQTCLSELPDLKGKIYYKLAPNGAEPFPFLGGEAEVHRKLRKVDKR